ncbi:MAG: peptide deformylase [Candidatus Omnitrophota bacterium]
MKETELKLRRFGDPALTGGVRLVKEVTQGHRKILSLMAQLMYETSGIGLASVQVGINEALIVVDAGTGLYKLINPKITKQEGGQAIEEGCLSVPGLAVKVKRAKKVVVEALDEFGKPVRIVAEDLLACVFQHEIDHLNGLLIVDHSPDKEKIKKNLQEKPLREND